MPASGLLWKNCASRVGSTPGTGTCAMKRKMTRITAVKISFRRRSGRFQALVSALSIVLAAFGGARSGAPPRLSLALLGPDVDRPRRLAVRDRHVLGDDVAPIAVHFLHT